jgi:hypothetical protein
VDILLVVNEWFKWTSTYFQWNNYYRTNIFNNIQVELLTVKTCILWYMENNRLPCFVFVYAREGIWSTSKNRLGTPIFLLFGSKKNKNFYSSEYVLLLQTEKLSAKSIQGNVNIDCCMILSSFFWKCKYAEQMRPAKSALATNEQ